MDDQVDSFLAGRNAPPASPVLGAGLATLTGITAAFGVAACCALPLFFASIGLGAAWLTGIALIAVPYRNALLLISGLTLAVGAILLWRQQRYAMTCRPGEKCMSASTRVVNFIALLLGGALLWAGYRYV